MLENIQNLLLYLRQETHNQVDHLSEKWGDYKEKSAQYYEKLSESVRLEIDNLQKDTDALVRQMKSAQDSEKDQLRKKLISNLERLTTSLKKAGEK